MTSQVELKNLEQIHVDQKSEAVSSRATTAASKSDVNDEDGIKTKPATKDAETADDGPVRTVHGLKVSTTRPLM